MKGLNPVQVIDIGGGMPANYDDDTPLDFRAYATVLKDNIPQLWGNDFRVLSRVKAPD